METNPSPPIHILYADDDADDREFFQEGISQTKLNYNLKLFQDGHEFLKHIQNPLHPQPDIIFLDINMPKVSGRECLQHVRNCSSFQKTPVIILSTSTLEAQNLLDEGANLFISKNNFFIKAAKFFSNLFVPGWKDLLIKKHLLFREPDKILLK